MNRIYTLINDFFSSKYANKSAIVGNRLSLMLYKLAYPTASLCARLSIKPNVVTWLSLLFTVFAVLGLFREDGPTYFVIFWLISMHLDFSDGTLARMTKKVSKSAFRLDHMTDLLKLFMVFLALGIYYNSFLTWVLASAAIFFLMYSEILTHEIKFYLKRSAENNTNFTESTILDSSLVKSLGGSGGLIISMLRNIHSVFFGISGHTLVFFCIVPFGAIYANSFLFYFTAVCIYGIIRTTITLSRIER